MKKLIIALVVLGTVFTTACKNKTSQQQGVEVKKDSIAAVDTSAKAQTKVAVPTVCVYKSNDGQTFTVKYYEKDGKQVAEITREGKPTLLLPQTQAWAKGAEYEEGGHKWAAQGDNATFTNKKGETKFKVVSQN